MLDWLAAGAGVIGKAMDMFSASKNRDMAMKQAQANQQLQLDFAKSGVQWRVEDAKAAGIHPLAALGMQGPSFSPVALGDAATPSTNFAGMGQDISRAITATRSQAAREQAFTNTARDLELTGKRLDNAFKATELASAVKRNTRDQVGPALPTEGPFVVPEAKKSEEQQPLMWMGNRVKTARDTSPAKAVEDNLGDDIFSPGFLWNAPAMIAANAGNMGFAEILKALDRSTMTSFRDHRGRPWHPQGNRSHWPGL